MSRILGARASGQGWLLASEEPVVGTPAMVPLEDRIAAALAEVGPLTEAEILEHLAEEGDATEVRRALLADSRIVMVDGGWALARRESVQELQLFDMPPADLRTKGRRRSLRGRAEVCLMEAGHPLTLRVLVGRMGGDVNVDSLKAQLSADDRFIRSDVSEWALRSWGIRRYTSVKELVAEELDEAGGAMSLGDLQRKLGRDFTINDATLRQVASTAPFTTSGGIVRRLNDVSGQSTSVPGTKSQVSGESGAELGAGDASADEIMSLMGL
ncbi:hypothetical protein RM844_31855 [Streptomyces sp. DSM 44915]|uniref:Uncharacterized protein n=1 Tax=Streptomyces chisholmiae TaxID=3075540 RepID=A0ABU2K263_9ACTN|nr:hypothetical protein [Streptomyces sp. DSM 44915]MDT0270874.1 hypothetical protein [Streptomyces sp. DSM 44915]